MPAYPYYSVDGVALDRGWCSLLVGTQLRRMPGVRNPAVVEVPGVHGQAPLVGGVFAASTYTLSLLVETEGTYASDAAETDAYAENLDAVFALFGQRHRVLDLRQHLSETKVRQADAELLTSVDPEEDFASGALSLVLTIPGVFWRDVATADHAQVMNALVREYEVATLAGSTAPVTDAVLLIDPPWTNPRVEDVATGAWVQVDDGPNTTQQLRLDLANFTAARGAGIGFTGAGSDVSGLVSNGGPGSGSRWLHLTPAMQGVDPRDRRVRVKFTTGSATATTAMTVRARRAFF